MHVEDAVDGMDVVQSARVGPTLALRQIRLQDPDRAFEPLELAHQHRSVRPWTGGCGDQHVAPDPDLEAGRAVAADVIAETRIRAHKAPISARHPQLCAGWVLLMPDAVHEHTHPRSPV